MSLQIAIRESGDVAILDLHGRWTTREDGELLNKHVRELVGRGKSKLLLNLVDLTQIDSSGVSIISKTHGFLKGAGGNLGLLNPGGHVLDVFRVLHLLDVIPSFEDEKQALTRFRSVGSAQKPKVSEGSTLFG